MMLQLNPSMLPFNLEYTLQCGQSFRWTKRDGWWYGVIGKKVVKLKQVSAGLRLEGTDEKTIRTYLRLDDDLPRILSMLSKDKYMRKVIRKLYGLRLLRQDPWECLISFMCAINTNVPAIKRMIFNLSRRFGEKIAFDRNTFYTFPNPYALANADVTELKRCKLGFRAEHVLETARLISAGEFDLEALRQMNYENAKDRLMALPGVGPKVADCVLLFSLDKLEAFPVDVWIKRIILTHYSSCFENQFVQRVLKKKSLMLAEYDKINSFGREYFGEYAGYAQQYLYAYHHLNSTYRQT